MSNVARFSGFAGLYDSMRPAPPPELGRLLCAYAGRTSPFVVDLGSGSGLSSRWAAQWAGSVVGVEPNDDMRAVAEQHRVDRVSYRRGTGTATGLESSSADVALAVQSLHWMDPEPTIAEIVRVLRPGGVFAALDTDWPPVTGSSRAERAWVAVERRIAVFEDRLALGLDLHAPLPPEDREHISTLDVVPPPGVQERGAGVRSWDKSGHLRRMAASGLFAFTRELVSSGRAAAGGAAADEGGAAADEGGAAADEGGAAADEGGAAADEGGAAAARFVGLMRSHGSYQLLRRLGVTDEELGIDELERAAREGFSNPQVRVPLGFGWRVRIGVRA